MDFFICPICKKQLKKYTKLYKCEKNHCYDRAKSGYVNLLTGNQKNSKVPGDNKLMVNSRHNFLNKGYYSILLDNLSAATSKYMPEKNCNILDIGCGEGYYTLGLHEYLTENNHNINIIGIDISKLALEKAANRSNKIDFAVASAFHIPVENNSCDILLNLFAPYCDDEFKRVLKANGLMFIVIPSENHLWELKKIVYPNPYKNEPKDYAMSGFKLLEKIVVEGNINVNSNEDILSLFTMTPYYYKTSKVDYEHLLTINSLQTTIQFEILVYRLI